MWSLNQGNLKTADRFNYKKKKIDIKISGTKLLRGNGEGEKERAGEIETERRQHNFIAGEDQR